MQSFASKNCSPLKIVCARAPRRSAEPMGNETYAVQLMATESPFTSFEPALACGDGRIAGEIILHKRNLAGQNLR